MVGLIAELVCSRFAYSKYALAYKCERVSGDSSELLVCRHLELEGRERERETKRMETLDDEEGE